MLTSKVQTLVTIPQIFTTLEKYLIRVIHLSLKDCLQGRHLPIHKWLLVGPYWTYYQYSCPKDNYFHKIHRMGMQSTK